MHTTTLGRTGLKVSVAGLGTGGFSGSTSRPASPKISPRG
jgi:aryl-alcohol dehydrogenase-like predicted oxidoreductase